MKQKLSSSSFLLSLLALHCQAGLVWESYAPPCARPLRAPPSPAAASPGAHSVAEATSRLPRQVGRSQCAAASSRRRKSLGYLCTTEKGRCRSRNLHLPDFIMRCIMKSLCHFLDSNLCTMSLTPCQLHRLAPSTLTGRRSPCCQIVGVTEHSVHRHAIPSLPWGQTAASKACKARVLI